MPPALAGFAELTTLPTSKTAVLIGNDQGGNSGLNAPNDVTSHGVLMSGEGIVGVEDYDRDSPRGKVNLLGGAIENFYGGFGTFNSSSGAQVADYGRAFTFGPRMRRNVVPPYFPTAGGKDEVQNVFSFGHREQLD